MTLGILFGITIILGFGVAANALEYPTKPIIAILPHPAGGGSDLTFRPLAQSASKYLGQPVICDNRGGGGGTIGPSIVATKPADGYNIGVILGGSYIAWQMGTLSFDPVDGITHIMAYTHFLLGIAVQSDSQWKTIQELIDFAKRNPGKITYGSTGQGNTAHLPMEELASQAGIKWTHMPLKGDAGTVPALLGGHVDVISATSGAWGPLVAANKFRLLATYHGAKRSNNYPNVPTLKEIGYDVVYPSPLEIFGPKNMPKPIVERLHSAFKKAMEDPNFQATLKQFDMPMFYLGPEDCENLARQDAKKLDKILRKIGLKAQ